MVSPNWQKQNLNLRNIVRAGSLVVSLLLSILLVSLDFLTIVQTSLLFLALFMLTEIVLAFTLKHRYANSLVRVLKFDYEEIEYDFRMLFKNKQIRFEREIEDEAYRYEFPGHTLSMTVQPHWVRKDFATPAVTKVTLHELTAENTPFAEMLAASIDEMASQRAGNLGVA